MHFIQKLSTLLKLSTYLLPILQINAIKPAVYKTAGLHIKALGLYALNQQGYTQKQATRAQQEVTEITNAMLKKNADLLKTSTIETAREAERSIIDIETLQHTNRQLISTLDEVMKIQTQGAAKRKEAEAELGRIEGELKAKLLELRA